MLRPRTGTLPIAALWSARYSGIMRRWLLAALMLAAPLDALAQPAPGSVPALVRAGRWAEAEEAAAELADPVARKLVLHERMLTPGAATAGEIAVFLRDAGAAGAIRSDSVFGRGARGSSLGHKHGLWEHTGNVCTLEMCILEMCAL